MFGEEETTTVAVGIAIGVVVIFVVVLILALLCGLLALVVNPGEPLGLIGRGGVAGLL